MKSAISSGVTTMHKKGNHFDTRPLTFGRRSQGKVNKSVPEGNQVTRCKYVHLCMRSKIKGKEHKS